jgi:hypothetical protein
VSRNKLTLGPAQIRIEGGRVTRPAELDFGRDIAEERDFQSARHRGRNLGLKFQHIAQVPVIGLRPQVKARDRIDQLRGDADGVLERRDAPFEDWRRRSVCARSCRCRCSLPLNEKCRGARGHLQLVDLGERVEQFLREPVGEVLLLLVPAQVHERQHRDRMRRRGEGDRGQCEGLREPGLVGNDIGERCGDDESNDREQHVL